MDSISVAQKDMRNAYFGGATGAVTSATAWMAAAIVSSFVSSQASIYTLIFGGMFIFPISLVVCKIVGRSGKHDKSNPLGPLAIQGTFWMLMSIAIAFGLSLYKPEWFFPAMLLTIGGRYLTFATLYGMQIYTLFGAILAISAFPLVVTNAPVSSGAYTGAIIEYIFAFVIFAQSTNKTEPATHV